MAAFSRFEDINVWQKSRKLVGKIYEVTTYGQFAKDYDLRSQIRRSSVSIAANIAEGFGRRSDKAFVNFLNISKGSASETQSHLYIAHDLRYLNTADFDWLYGELDQCSRMMTALIKRIRARES